MRGRGMPLNTIIAIEGAVFLLLVVLLCAFLPRLSENEPVPDAGHPGLRAAVLARAASPALRPEESSPPGESPTSRLRSRNFTKALKAVPDVGSALISLSSARVKTEPQREIRWKRPGSPGVPSRPAARTPISDPPM